MMGVQWIRRVLDVLLLWSPDASGRDQVGARDAEAGLPVRERESGHPAVEGKVEGKVLEGKKSDFSARRRPTGH